MDVPPSPNTIVFLGQDEETTTMFKTKLDMKSSDKVLNSAEINAMHYKDYFGSNLLIYSDDTSTLKIRNLDSSKLTEVNPELRTSERITSITGNKNISIICVGTN